MKFIKNFESVKEPLYNIDDYIFVRRQISKKKIYKGVVKIIDIEEFTTWGSEESKYQYLTVDEILDDPPHIVCYLDVDIKRKATSEEIENFEMRRNAKKYNL